MEKKRISNAPLPETTELMNCEIVKVIARGRFSFVYSAKNKKKQFVAIKEYIPQRTLLREQAQLDLTIPSEKRREFCRSLHGFFSECRTLSDVTNPGIVRFIEFFRTRNTFYIVMNYAPGSSLKEFIRRRIDNIMSYNKDSLLNACPGYRHFKK
jgi:serine/threonine protein kinase